LIIDIVNDDCGDMMFSVLVLGMSGIHIRCHILGNVFIQLLQTFILLLSRFTFLTFFILI